MWVRKSLRNGWKFSGSREIRSARPRYEPRPLRGVGQLALVEEVPHVLDRTRLGELDCVVLPVVVEAFEAANVADRGLGDHDAFQTARHVLREMLGRLDLGDAHQVAHRHDADELVAVDDRDVPIAVLGERGERGGRLDVGRDRIGVGRHPVGDGLGADACGGEAHQITLGEDADRASVVDDDHGADTLGTHPLGCGRHRLVGRRRDGRVTHDLADSPRFGTAPARRRRHAGDPTAAAFRRVAHRGARSGAPAPRSSSGFPVTARARREPADPGAGVLVRERRGAQVELVAERFVE